MKEKKAPADWYVAATHWLTAGFVIPFLMALIIGIPFTMLLGEQNILLMTIGFAALYILSVWLGVMYSAKYLDKTYIIRDNQKIALLSTVYLAVIGGGLRLLKLFQTGAVSSEILGFIVGVVVFYAASKKYVKNNASSSQPAGNVGPASGSAI